MLRRFPPLATALIVASAAALAACGAGPEPESAAETDPAMVDGTDGPLTPADVAFLDTLQERTFRWFIEYTNPENGLTRDRAPTPSFSSVAAVGFSLTAYPIGVERGWMTREEAAELTATTLRFFWNAPQGPDPEDVTGYKGFFYHFVDMETGYRYQQVELSTIDTALMLMGALFAQQYFDGDDPLETEIRELTDSIYYRVEWDWAQVNEPLVSMGWHPETGFIDADWRGYNEAMFLYVLALASPTHPVEPAAWDAWTETYDWGTFHGSEPHVGFAPYFGHQYSHVWIDFRGIQDDYMRERGIDYFENSRRALHAQRNYAIANPNEWEGYGENMWGLTASDGPISATLEIDGRERQFFTYSARGASFTRVRDDGTLVPTALGGSIPFDPEITVAGLRAMRERYGDYLFTEYGFLDAFNPTLDEPVEGVRGRIVPGVGWFNGDYLGIDQGPIVIMIENQRTDMVWRLMRQSPYIRTGLERAGFTGGWLDDEDGGTGSR